MARNLLKTLERTVEMGNYSVLASQIEQFGPQLRVSPDADVKKGFQELLERAEPCFEIERIHGKGSLLNLEHPTIQRFILVDRLIHPIRFEAALRYRSSMGNPFDPETLSPPPGDAKRGLYATPGEAMEAAWVHADLKTVESSTPTP